MTRLCPDPSRCMTQSAPSRTNVMRLPSREEAASEAFRITSRKPDLSGFIAKRSGRGGDTFVTACVTRISPVGKRCGSEPACSSITPAATPRVAPWARTPQETTMTTAANAATSKRG